MACGFRGNSDIFGIGIRVGYYAQLVAIWFSNYFYLAEAKGLRAVNQIFLLALIVVGFTYFSNAHDTHVVEAFLLLQIGIVMGLVGIAERTRYTSKFRQVSRESLVLRISVMAFGCMFKVLFWWKGVQIMIPTPCNDRPERSQTYTFFGWKVGLYGWFRILMQALSIGATVFAAPRHISEDAGTLVYDIRMKESRKIFTDAVDHIFSQYDISTGMRPNDGATQSSSAPHGESRLSNTHRPTAQSSKKITHALAKPSMLPSKPIFKEDDAILGRVRQAEEYLDSLYSIYELEDPKTTTDTSENAKSTPSLSKRSKYRCIDDTPYAKCLFRTAVAQFANQPPFDMRACLNYHFLQTGTLSSHHYTRLLHRMLHLSKNPINGIQTPKWQDFKLATDIHLSQIPVHQSMGVWATQATLHAAFIAALIVQVELTIVWNHVEGLYSLANLGQLIPFITGTGVLLRLFWSKARASWKRTECLTQDGSGMSGYEVAMARYVEMRKCRGGTALARIATA